MSAPHLLADRFLVAGDRSVVDLATGEPVFMRVARDVGPSAEWAERCASLTALRHPWLAECLDFGLAGDAHAFEAFRLAVPQAHRLPMPDTMVRGVRAFLGACGLSMGLECTPIRGRHVVLPVPRADGGAPPDEHRALWPPGLELRPRAALAAIVERLRDEPRPGISWCDVAAAPGHGGRTLLRQAAREARLLGWVPLSVRLLSSRSAPAGVILEAVRERHVLVLQDARVDGSREDEEARAGLARLAFVTSRPCLALRLVAATAHTELRLDALTRREREEAEIRPGRRRRGWRASPDEVPSAAFSAHRLGPASLISARSVREAHAGFGAVRDAPLRGAKARYRPVLVAGGTRAPDALRTAQEALALGRHAAAERLLRRAAAEAARRSDASAAGTLWLAATRLLLDRGRPAAAKTTAVEAAEWLARASNADGMIEGAVLLGRASLLLLQAEPAEAAFRSACVIARESGEPGAARLASHAAAEGFWWLGRFDDAAAALGEEEFSPSEESGDRVGAVESCAMAARVAMATGASAAAARHVGAAEAIARDGPPRARLGALLARARWLATTGDLRTLAGVAASGLEAAASGRARMEGLDLRLLRAEGALRARAPEVARAMARGLGHLAAGPTPPLVAARARLVLLAIDARADAERLRESLVTRGFGAFASVEAAGLALPPPEPRPRSPMLEDVIEMLRVCQEEEPRVALVRVAELLRGRSSAAVVAILTGGPAPLAVTVPSSARAVLAVRRALDAGIAIALHDVDAGQEAAVPMRHGGALAGALGCRWVSHAPGDAAGIARLLEAAAAAAGPCARALGESAAPAPASPDGCELAGSSQAIQAVRRLVAQAADAPFSVLIEGESGSGKELAARAIHRASPRRLRPFCAVNGAALPDDLLEAELFGHARGAFTGAVTERRGVFEEADGGVLFLDEVGELSMRAQAKLLRVIQEGEIRRLGEAHVRRVDVRLVTATNRHLETEVAAGRFRRDLYYRLAVIRIVMPPLRDRADDVPGLAAEMWVRAAQRVGSRAVLSAATLAALARYDWPGNVRELQNVLAALAVVAPRRGVIGPSLLPAVIAQAAGAQAGVTLDEARRHFEARFVRAALARAGGHRGRAAADLGLTRQGLAKLLERLGVTAPDETPATLSAPSPRTG